jgi:UDP-N-acetylglucosamine 1-carboxyvinyltransferase
MDKLLIEGGVPLHGRIRVGGAKNAALPLMASSILAEGVHTLSNVPRFMDVRTFQKLLAQLGARCEHEEKLQIDTTGLNHFEAPYDLVKTMRASVLVLGPLVGRYGRAKVSLPGGCAIGARPINLHLMGLEAMGARITLEHGYVLAEADRLKGADITFETVTVTGTENLMMAASLADGTTVLKNAAREPEVVDLAEYLSEMGARIEGAGTPEITVYGVEELRPAEHRVIPDRIETGTYLVAAGITGGHLTIEGCRPDHVEAVTAKLHQAGLDIQVSGETMEVSRLAPIQGVNVKTWPFPGFPTDMQAQFMALMTLAEGGSLITEQIFENRFMHVNELQRMGADIQVDGRCAMVRGVDALSGAPVMASDLRASASLVLAGLAAQNTTEIRRVYHLDRGYERLDERLEAVGARIRRERGGL